MPLNPLARAIYSLLRLRAPAANPEQCKLRYQAVVDGLPDLPPEFANLSCRDPRLDRALGDLVTACRAANRPAISAMVVNESGYPGKGYYDVANPGVVDPEERTIVYYQELTQVAGQTYPPLTPTGDIPA